MIFHRVTDQLTNGPIDQKTDQQNDLYSRVYATKKIDYQNRNVQGEGLPNSGLDTPIFGLWLYERASVVSTWINNKAVYMTVLVALFQRNT